MKKSNIDLLIVGTIPPPIGGVTIYTERLLKSLDIDSFDYKFFDYKKDSFLNGLKFFFQAKIIHLNLNNPLFLFCIILFSKILNKRTILTLHCEYNVHYSLMNYFEKYSLILADFPLVLNNSDLQKVKTLNSNTRMISSFIPFHIQSCLDQDIVSSIMGIKNCTEFVFSTNANKLAYNNNGLEIYGIIELVNYFNSNSKYGLIVSDPSGQYSNYFKINNFNLNKNILLIQRQHSFINVLMHTDGLIRNTITDGSSISIFESLYLGKPVFATPCVPRPDGVFLINIPLDQYFNSFDTIKTTPISLNIPNGYKELCDIYSMVKDI